MKKSIFFNYCMTLNKPFPTREPIFHPYIGRGSLKSTGELQLGPWLWEH